MNLRIKTLIIIGAILVLMIVIIFSSTKTILLNSYSTLEKQNILQDTDQAIRMVDDEIAQIASVVGDWAPWDDTYDFVQNRNQDYIDDNLNDETIINLPIGFLIFLDSENDIVYCKYVDPAAGEGAACPECLGEYVISQPFLTRNGEGDDYVKGIDILPEAPILIASGPVLTSHFAGPAKGILVAGRFLFPKEVERLAEKVRLSI